MNIIIIIALTLVLIAVCWFAIDWLIKGELAEAIKESIRCDYCKQYFDVSEINFYKGWCCTACKEKNKTLDKLDQTPERFGI